MKVRTAAFLNPLFVYSVMWSLVLLAYQLGWSRIYAPLNSGLFLFFVATIVISAGLGVVLQRWLDQHRFGESSITSSKCAQAISAVVALAFVADFFWGGQIPLLAAFTQDDFAYAEFEGIPVLHVVIVTFSFFYAACLAYAWSRSTGRRRHVILAQLLLILSMHLLMLSRQAVLLILLMWALFYLSSERLSFRRLLAAGVIGIGVAYLFGCIGNVRNGLAFNDNSYIIQLSMVSDSYPDWMPGQFLWAYMYLVSPLGNLNGLVSNFAAQQDWGGTAVNVVPDFISKRVFPDFDASTPLVVDYFNVSTGFATAWKFGGFVGLWATFGVLIVIVMLFALIVRGPLALPTLAILCGMTAFMFFNNALSFSGVSFALAFPLIATSFGHLKDSRSHRTRRRGKEQGIRAD